MKIFGRLIIYCLVIYSIICININPNYSGYEIPFINDYLVHNLNVKTTRIRDTKHKRYHLYNNLNDTQKVVYDALLTQSIDILEGDANTTSVYLTLDTLGFETDAKGHREIKKQWQDYFYSELGIKSIIKALECDYGYYTWWYGGGAYIYQTKFIPIITNGDYSKSIVEIEIKSDSSNGAYYVNDSLLVLHEKHIITQKKLLDQQKECLN